jgi:rhodanese-related sulfurtransferase
MRLRTAEEIPSRRSIRRRIRRAFRLRSGRPVTRLDRPYTGFMLEYEISPLETVELLRNNEVRLIDVREPWEYATARIGGSVLMPMGDVPSRAHQELDPDERIVVLCHHGMRSMNVAVWLRNQGFEQAQSMRGGIDAWAAEVDPSVGRY